MDGVGSARQRTTGALSASVSGSPDHLPTGHPPTGHTPGEGDGGGCYGAHCHKHLPWSWNRGDTMQSVGKTIIFVSYSK